MTPRAMFDSDGPSRAATLAHLFDLLLVLGYVGCGVLTYFVWRAGVAPATPPKPTPPAAVAVAEMPPDDLDAPSPEPAAPELADLAPDAEPKAPTIAGDRPAVEEPKAPSVEDQILTAMGQYVDHLNKGEWAKARAMRADPDPPSEAAMKAVQSMELVKAVPYKAISKGLGAVYVTLKFKRDGSNHSFVGRIDWRRQGDRWVTTEWNSAATPPK